MKTVLTRTLVVTTALVAMTAGAFAADWLEKVEIGQGGIDLAPVQVGASANGYTGNITYSHRFSLGVYARATSGERIVGMKVGNAQPTHYFESDGGHWHYQLPYRDIGSGKNRTVSTTLELNIPVNKVVWSGFDPRALCASNLNKQVQNGMRKHAVLSKTWELTTAAYFEVDAVAARKNKAANNKWNIGNTSSQRDTYSYPVHVRCLPAY